MSDDKERKHAQERRQREATEYRSSEVNATCLHCGNLFPASGGVVTPDAAICYVCNDSD